MSQRYAIDDAALAAALRAADGSQGAAARALGVSSTWIGDRLAADPSLWPEGVTRRAQGHRGVTDDQVRAAIASAGSYEGAAALLRVSRQTVWSRVQRRPEVWPEGIPRPMRWRGR